MQPEEPVESCEMIHMAVANEDVADPEHLARGKQCEIASIKQQSPPTEAKIDEYAGISERVVHQPGLDQSTHASSTKI
jgi:hypothetical protein